MSYNTTDLDEKLSKNKLYLGIFFMLVVLFSPNLVGTMYTNVWPIFSLFVLMLSVFLIKKFYKNNFLLIIPFLFFLLISILNSIRFSEYGFLLHMKEVFRSFLYIIVLLFFLTFSEIERERFLEKFCKIIVFFSIASLTIYLLTLYSRQLEGVIFNLYYNLAGDSENIAYSRSRIALTVGNPNALAFFSSVMFYIFWMKGKCHDIFKLLILMILGILLILTFSRTGYIAFIISLITYLILFYKNSIKIIVIFLFLTLILIFLFNNLFLNIIDRVSYTSLGGRDELWENALKSNEFQSNLLFGVSIIPSGIFIDNDYVTLLFKFGFLGFFVYFAVLGYMILLNFKNFYIDLEKRKDNFLLLMLFLHIFIFSFTSSIITSYKMSLLVLPLLSLFCLPVLLRREK